MTYFWRKNSIELLTIEPSETRGIFLTVGGSLNFGTILQNEYIKKYKSLPRG